MEKKLMIVDDEAGIREILQFNLENAGYKVDCASSAEEALEMLSSDHCLILLDVMMGGMSGLRMAEVLRNEHHNEIPIIFLTARTDPDDLLAGFSAGGDDYIPKPFSIQEVIARVKAVLKRTASVSETSDMIHIGEIRIDKERKMVYVNGEPVAFSKKEFEVLLLLASHPGQIFSRENIIDELWKDAPYVLDRTVDVHIARIRSKLGSCKNYLTNRTGYGYVFNCAE
ncbi:MAG: response regulator transcription factor [Bacteroidales bacterium]|nr:response regulator transcription factor [Bacteroidales bacterium]